MLGDIGMCLREIDFNGTYRNILCLEVRELDTK